MAASLWIMPFRVSERPLPSLAVMVWSMASTWPCVTVGAPPWPSALPSASTASPALTLDESARVTVGRPETPSIWISATSAVGETPMTRAVYVPLPETTTEMLIEPSTTWLLVSTSPDEVMIMPVPAAEPVPVVVWMTVLMSTIAGATAAVIVCTLMVPFWLLDGGAAVMGAVALACKEVVGPSPRVRAAAVLSGPGLAVRTLTSGVLPFSSGLVVPNDAEELFEDYQRILRVPWEGKLGPKLHLPTEWGGRPARWRAGRVGV